MAAFSGNASCCTYLIRNGAEINVKDKNGHTPLFKASMMGWETVVLLLINEGALVDDVDNHER